MLLTDTQVPGSETRDPARLLGKARRLDLFTGLDQLYAELPETRRGCCGRCCFESPGLFYVEYLRLLELLAARPAEEREALVGNALRELLFSWIEPTRTCLFLGGEGRCTIYDQRPLVCRLFGLTPPSDPERAEHEMHLAAAEEARELRRLGVRIPKATLVRARSHCRRVRSAHGRRPKTDADALADRAAALDSQLLPREVVLQEYCFVSLPDRLGNAMPVSDRLGASMLGGEVVEELRLQLLRRAQQGESVEQLLAEVLAQTQPPAILRRTRRRR